VGMAWGVAAGEARGESTGASPARGEVAGASPRRGRLAPPPRRLEPVQHANSASNSEPWRTVHEECASQAAPRDSGRLWRVMHHPNSPFRCPHRAKRTGVPRAEGRSQAPAGKTDRGSGDRATPPHAPRRHMRHAAIQPTRAPAARTAPPRASSASTSHGSAPSGSGAGRMRRQAPPAAHHPPAAPPTPAAPRCRWRRPR
jgi:hypothetical protein